MNVASPIDKHGVCSPMVEYDLDTGPVFIISDLISQLRLTVNNIRTQMKGLTTHKHMNMLVHTHTCTHEDTHTLHYHI